MRILRTIGWTLLSIIGVLAVVVGIFIYTSTPDYDGEKPLSGLSDEVEVYFDTYGIPHIYGKNKLDAFTALGYVHAQDRLWQMELLRRIGRGGISEIFGREFIETDQFFLALGIDDASVRTIAELDRQKESVQLSQAYLDGINQFMEEGPTPVEFYLTGIEKEKFTLKDVYNTMGYMAFSFAMAHKTDPLLTRIRDSLGPEYLKDLKVESDTTSVWIQNYGTKSMDSLKTTTTTTVMASLKKLSIPLFEGSNSWVLAPEKTKSGKVIFANDPHIGFSQPSVWYEAHVSAPSYEKYGYHLAGVPFPLLAHDRNLAYGMTMFENDDVDFYYEEIDPSDSTKYKTDTGWRDFEIVSKTIKVKDSSDIHFSFKKTNNGPVLNGIADQIAGARPVSMWWAYTQLDNKVMDALYGMSHAQNIQEFQQALPNIHAPGLNIMYGDAVGNVAWWASAQLYHIPDSINTKIVYDFQKGLSPTRDYLDFSENPQAVNPPWHYVYSANNQPDSIAGMLYPGYYLPENRAKRIVSLLGPKNDWDAESVRRMMLDVTSPVNTTIASNLLKEVDRGALTGSSLEALAELQAWKGDYPLHGTAATLFHRWMYFLLAHTFQDELGSDAFAELLDTHLIKRVIAPLSEDDTSLWWDDTNTPEVIETKREIVNASLREALQELEKDLGKDRDDWTWDRVHTLEHAHPIGQVEALKSLFNVGPFPVPGTREVINNMAFPYTGNGVYHVSSGPSTRRIIDFSDIENSRSILPTGQSGNPFSRHYRDQAEMFAEGKFREMMIDEEEIRETSGSALRFIPEK
ncbi:penicillin acylase family protein [Pricia sp. S334]|uniref:Penicillin acylase family protein n=1 Tax=Pricia mediterranea TaxID=3076079 RepID=A0ABU3L9S2_9FLAO|nr:penicillin acylase family protein [Pricia sp. S334]MDT7830481.1 penicillin acylase family protein [Pricia sp. S334]